MDNVVSNCGVSEGEPPAHVVLSLSQVCTFIAVMVSYESNYFETLIKANDSVLVRSSTELVQV